MAKKRSSNILGSVVLFIFIAIWVYSIWALIRDNFSPMLLFIMSSVGIVLLFLLGIANWKTIKRIVKKRF